MIIDKTQENNWILDWHQDRRIAVTKPIDTPGFSNWSSQYGVNHVCAPLEVLQNFLIARIGLDNLTKENGAIYIIPNSHKGDIYNHGEIVEKVNEDDATLYEMELGDLMLMSPLLIHNSPGSRRSNSRRILSIEFSALPLPNGLSFLI